MLELYDGFIIVGRNLWSKAQKLRLAMLQITTSLVKFRIYCGSGNQCKVVSGFAICLSFFILTILPRTCDLLLAGKICAFWRLHLGFGDLLVLGFCYIVCLVVSESFVSICRYEVSQRRSIIAAFDLASFLVVSIAFLWGNGIQVIFCFFFYGS